MNMFEKYVPYQMEDMHSTDSSASRVVRAVAWHWKVLGSIPDADMPVGIFDF